LRFPCYISENSLLRSKIPCSAEQGILAQLFEIAPDNWAPITKNCLKNRKFPVLFPASTEFEAQTGSHRPGSSATEGHHSRCPSIVQCYPEMATRQETLRGRCGFDGVSGYFHCKDALFGILFMMGSRAANGRRLPVMTTALLCSIAFAMDRFAWK